LGLVGHDEGGYGLTAEGRKLSAALTPLSDWARQWKPAAG